MLAKVEQKAKTEMIKQGSEPDRTRLVADLLKEYDSRINPDDIKLKFGVTLLDFNVREDIKAIDSYVWLKYVWEDDRLAWDPKDYGGAEVIRLDPTAIWKPDVTLYNSADPVNMVNCWESNTLIYPTGKVLWVPPCKMTSMCNLKLKKQPYGEQECHMKFGSWTLDGNILDLQLYNGTKGLDLAEMHNSSGFEIVSTTAQRNSKEYSCCPGEPYIDLTFNMTIRRLSPEELFHKL